MRLYTLDGKCNISGERIKSARAKAKLTQDQLAARLQVAGLQMGQMAISRIESGKRLVPDFELPIIAEALNVSTDWLLGIEKCYTLATRSKTFKHGWVIATTTSLPTPTFILAWAHMSKWCSVCRSGWGNCCRRISHLI